MTTPADIPTPSDTIASATKCPAPAWQPTCTEDVINAVRRSIALRQQLHFGGKASTNSVDLRSAQICLRRMDQVIDYPARDMTITVQAGMTIGTLQEILLKEGQQLPVDCNSPEQRVGSLVASDTFGPRKFGYGTLRDYVIGVEAVDGRGRVFQAGGRVVKNVAGYDLCRLMVGSSGQLGILTQVTFKLKPMVEAARIGLFGFNRLSEVEASIDRLNLSAARPVAIEVMNRLAANAVLLPTVFCNGLPEHSVDCNFFLLCTVEGTPAVCEWQVESLQAELELNATWKWIEPPGQHKAGSSAAVYQRIMQLQRPAESTEWLARLTTLPSRVVSSISMLEPHSCMVFGRAANGIVYFRRENRSSDETTLAQSYTNEHTDPGLPEPTAISTLNNIVNDDIGSVLMLKAKELRGATLPKQTMQLMTALCRTFDPNQIFSSHSN